MPAHSRAAKSAGRAPLDAIRVRGARVHNLRNVDIDLPRDRLVVITGPSGSGKSSLAFDTLFAEGQRQYIETLSVYARQFVDQLERPDVDLIDGLQPTIAIDQQAGQNNPRSTVATVTEIYDYLRLLWARVGEPHCGQCDARITQQSADQILERILALPTGTKVVVLAPRVRGRKGEHADVLESIRKAGCNRVRVDGILYELDQVPPLARQKVHSIEAVVDRVVVRDQLRPRLAESLRRALDMGDGVLSLLTLPPGSESTDANWSDRLYSTEFTCPECQASFEELEPRTFSFNSPYGACTACDGLGTRETFVPERIVPDTSLSLSAGAILPWRTRRGGLDARKRSALETFAAALGVDLELPLNRWKPKQRKGLLEGLGPEQPGVLAWLEQEWSFAEGTSRRRALEPLRAALSCPACGGARLRPEGRAVRLANRRIHQLTALPVVAARAFFDAWQPTDEQRPIAKPILRELIARLDFLDRVGLAYLTLDRPADTLSGGELQRIRLATGIGSGLVGTCYILDEPSIGLHPRDTERLYEALRSLQQLGNTVLVVEHDETLMRRADWLVDIGPGAGVHGGKIVAQGTPDEVANHPRSITGQYLSGVRSLTRLGPRRPLDLARQLVLTGASAHNLLDVEASIPVGLFTCVTGVSGSGKSSLFVETLARAVRRALGGEGPEPAPFRELRGVEQFDKFIEIDQSPIGRTPRSNPATYTGAFDEIRQLFAQTKEAKLRGYKASRFSFNVGPGRCETCQGQGLVKLEMNFLPDLYVPCAVCRGARFNPQTLEVRFRDRSIADVLALSVDEAADCFENVPTLRRLLEGLQQVGLGYLTLGQPCTTLSGGEAQRIKLATELARVDTGRTLYLLDEPTTGLHFDDVRQLLDVLNRLVERGNTVLVIEHHLDVMQAADWIIDLGPGGGAEGGRIVARGTPEDLAARRELPTGAALAEALARAQA